MQQKHMNLVQPGPGEWPGQSSQHTRVFSHGPWLSGRSVEFWPHALNTAMALVKRMAQMTVVLKNHGFFLGVRFWVTKTWGQPFKSASGCFATCRFQVEWWDPFVPRVNRPVLRKTRWWHYPPVLLRTKTGRDVSLLAKLSLFYLSHGVDGFRGLTVRSHSFSGVTCQDELSSVVAWEWRGLTPSSGKMMTFSANSNGRATIQP